MVGILTTLLTSIPQLIREFVTLLLMSIPQAILLIVGGILMAFTLVLLGYLTLGALLSPAGGLPTPGKGPQNE